MPERYASSEPSDVADEKVPGWTPELGTRLKEVLKRVGGLRQASTIVGYKAEQIAKWRDGNARPPFYALQTLAKAAGVSLDWIAGTETSPGAPIVERSPAVSVDDELMGRITDAIARLYKDERVGLAPIDLGRLTARKYAEVVAATDDAAERLAMIKLIVTQLRADLRSTAEAPGTGKRLA
ncbi:putative helix-turn-helix XRE-family like protein [Azorhizobium caulinodans ORS 571]|uniref:Putative helix-turn-helix XRE-family like protein n=1 Tax=Azorhizobium caulinodans (strain ATCC 43989 / DSM 5975 / JCM 20966 / LMG 6465 / NBRC 14845 / NCIMB 13405 / ORS 571) TaxID=438753 RepID=A8I7I1_AZOC5|nr:helix-turn-helix transcriptional regulator [Azorhizobium caulinodans]BAF88122.1 putative helix-turn-helix XRE-family like protein [Azorhizobium caulinodans ORS 571]